MSEHRSVRKFRQINRIPPFEYLAKEIHFVEVEPGKIRSIMIFDDDTRIEGPTVDEKIHKMNIEGFDIVSKGKDGVEIVTARHTGMLENKAWEEIFDTVPPAVEATMVEERQVA